MLEFGFHGGKLRIKSLINPHHQVVARNQHCILPYEADSCFIPGVLVDDPLARVAPVNDLDAVALAVAHESANLGMQTVYLCT